MPKNRRQYEPGARIPGTVYDVIKLIGSGGMGTVYDVEDTTVGKRYVLKTLHADLGNRDDLAKRMQSEARALARLSHTNIVEVVTAGVTSDELQLPYYVMERLNGQNLRAILSKRGSLELPHALHIGIDLLEALEAAHDLQILHRDVKPDNIFLHRGANNVTVTKLLDFGIARDTSVPSMTGDRFVGTLRYAAPEQIKSNQVSVRSDLYAAGLVIYEMIAGRGPFDDATNLGEVAQFQMTRIPASLNELGLGVPPELDKLLRSALAKDPGLRPKDAFTFASHLRNLKRKGERPFLNSDSRPTAVAIIQGLDTSKPPSPSPLPFSPVPPSPPAADPVASAEAPGAAQQLMVAPAPAAPVAYASTLHAATRASTPSAKSPEPQAAPAQGFADSPQAPSPSYAPSPPQGLLSWPGHIPQQGSTHVSPVAPSYAAPGVGVASPAYTPTSLDAPRVDRSATTQTSAPAPQSPVGLAGTQVTPISQASPPWAAGFDAIGIRDTIRETVPAGVRADPSPVSAQQLLVAFPSPSPGPNGLPRTDPSSVRSLVPPAPPARLRAVVIASVGAGVFVAGLVGAVAIFVLARHGDAATAPSAPTATALASPTLATPLFDEVPSAGASTMPSAQPPSSGSAAPAASIPAPTSSAASPSGPPSSVASPSTSSVPLAATASRPLALPASAKPAPRPRHPAPPPLPPELDRDYH